MINKTLIVIGLGKVRLITRVRAYRAITATNGIGCFYTSVRGRLRKTKSISGTFSKCMLTEILLSTNLLVIASYKR